jgi:catalase
MSDQVNKKPPVTTNDSGIPAANDEHSLSVGANGPLLLQDHYLVQKLAQFNRERVPERVVHARGTGAFGYFEVTADVSQWTKAAFLNGVGKRTPLVIRFSTVAGELGSADTVRDPRGFAVKFYTEEGNYDLVGNNTPIFFIRDTIKFPDFIHSQKRVPSTGLPSHTAQWDFWTLYPESAHQVTYLMTDRGTPHTLRHMNGYGSHTYMWINAKGEKFWVKYHFISDQGVENFTNAEAGAMGGQDPNFHRRDLLEAIDRKDYPSWQLKIQIMPYEDAATYRFNPFDLTKIWPHSDYPLITIGRMVLDHNPANMFNDIEQLALSPANMVPGIAASPDKMLQGRIFSYPDAHRYRIGTNYNQLPVNQPLSEMHNYNKDGAMSYRHNGNQPHYSPNTFNGPQADTQRYGEPEGVVISGEVARTAYTLRAEDNDFIQPGNLYRNVLSETEKEHLVTNIVAHMSQGVDHALQERVIKTYWSQVDPDLGRRVAKGLGLEVSAGAR